MSFPAADAARTFAANRAFGRVELTAGVRGDRTRRRLVREEGSLRLRFPNPSGPALEAVVINTAGGIAGGDTFAVRIDAHSHADAIATTAAAEKVYRSDDRESEVALTLNVAASARLAWLPQETILFDGARLSRRIEVDLAADASLVLVESMIFGRRAMNETVVDGSLIDRWRVRRDGRLIFAETTRLGDGIAERLAMPAVANGAIATATVLIAPGEETQVAAVRECGPFCGEAGISAWNGIAVARLCARDGAALRRDLIALLAALQTPLPRLWLQ